MARKGVYLVPTLGQSYVTGQRGAELGRPQWLQDISRAGWPARLERFGYAVKAGVKIGAGTDVIADMFDELEMLVWGGLTTMQAIEAATRVNAEIMHETDRLGTVTAGKLADVIVVDGDPLADIKAMRKVSLVFKGGRLFRPADLAASTNPEFC
jgi:imidazolonepropionase-like amidohydrolase